MRSISLLDQFIELAVHLHLLDLLAHVLVEQARRLSNACSMARAQIVERLLAFAAIVVHMNSGTRSAAGSRRAR